MADIFYTHRAGLLSLSALTVFYIALDRFKEEEISEQEVARMSKEGLRVFGPILNNRKVTGWMRELGINWKKRHNWIIMTQGELIEFYWMSYGDKDPIFISNLFRKILDVRTDPLPSDFTYQVAYDEYRFSQNLAACREIMELNHS